MPNGAFWNHSGMGRDSFFQSIQAGMEAMAKEQGAELLVNIHEHDINQETKFIEDSQPPHNPYPIFEERVSRDANAGKPR